MSDYNIKIGVDTRAASRGVKSFASDLGGALKALRDFDKKASGVFTALDRLSKINAGNLSKVTKSVAQAVNDLNRIKVNRSLVNNLQSLQKALSGIRFSGANSLKKLPDALKSLDSIRVNPNLISILTGLKTALKGWSGPPKSISNWSTAFKGLDAIRIPATLAKRVAELKIAVKGFVGPARSAWNLPHLLSQIARNKISPTLATNVAALKAALAGFHGPSAKAGPNLAALISAMNTANPSQIAAVASALQKLNGLNIKLGRTLSQIGQSGKRGFGGMRGQIHSASQAMNQFYQHAHMAQRAMWLLQTALGGISMSALIKGIYDTGASYMQLQRTLGAIATSSEEVESHLQFINDLTTKMPVSLDAAHKAFSKFAVAARLSGMSMEDTQKIFENFSVGFTAMGLSADSQKYAFLALEQMVSKGVIQMEELRRQLGDHLPGAVQLLADSLDVPVSKLYKMIEAGEVGSEALIKMGERVAEQFGPAAAAAFNSSQGQITMLDNAWIKFKRTVFGTDFNAALGAMANSFAKILESADFQKFAADIGKAFGRAFRAIAALGQYLADNRETVIQFLKAFAGYGLVVASASALRLLLGPLALLGPAFTIVAGAIGLMGSAMKAIVTGKVLTSMASFFSKLTGKAMIAVIAIVGMAAAFDMLYQMATGKKGNFDSLFDGLASAARYAMGQVTGVVDSMFAGVDGELDSYMADFNKKMDEIANQDLKNQKTFEDNEKRQAALRKQKLATLSEEAQKTWEKLNPLLKETEEYQKQLALINEIAKKKNLTSAEKGNLIKTLDAQTLADRNPLGALARDYQIELDALRAKTGEQRALNKAKEVERELILKNIHLTQEQVAAIADYHKGIAMMNGEIGNGIERWTAKVGDFNEQIQNAIADGIESLSDELAGFLSGAEADFASLARSILKTFIKISLDSLLKDLFGAMGMDGAKNGASMAEQALSKIAGMGENITTAMTNVYTSGLAVNGVPLGSTTGVGSMANSPELPSKRIAAEAAERAAKEQITRAPLPNIPGTDVAAPYPGLSTERFKLETPVEKAIIETPKIQESTAQSMTELAKTAQTQTGQFDTMLKGMERVKEGYLPTGSIGAATTVKTDRLGYIDPNINPERFGFQKTITDDLRGTIGNVPGLRGTLPAGGTDPWEAMAGAKGTKSLDLTPKDIIDLKKGLMTEWVTSAGTDQGKGIIDTMLNRQASGKWGTRMEDVLNARKQFSDINGPPAWKHGRTNVDQLSTADPRYARSSALVDQYLQQRAAGQESIVGDHLNYANRKYSTPNNYGWIDKLEGPQFGRGNSIHKHGTTAGLQKYRPGEYDVNLPGQQSQTAALDPAATQGIDQMKTKLAEVGTAAQTTAPQMDQMKTKLTETGTSAQTAGQQTAMANQTKAMAEQTSAMNTQMAGQSIQMAGVNAQTASPQFQQAGQSIQMAGQQAQMAGASAQTAQPGLGGFGQGIMGLLGPLASAIPGLGQFGGMIMQLIQSLMGGMGGLGGGLFKEGGIATSPMSRATLPAVAWSAAPHYDDGIANTSGGLPAVLHPNEAVIPLTRGRKVPVEMGDDSRGTGQEKVDNRNRPLMVLNISGVKDADSFKRSKSQIASSMASMQQRAMARNG